MAFRSDRWARAFWRGHGLQRASALMAQKEGGSQFYYVLKQGTWVGIGFVAMLVMMQFNYQQLKSRRMCLRPLAFTTLTLFSVFAFQRQ